MKHKRRQYKMIEDAINRLAAAIEAQNLIQAENQRLFAELVAAGRPVTPAAAVVVESVSESEQKIERKSKKKAEVIPIENPIVEPEATSNSNVSPVTRKDLTDFALSLSRQDSEFGDKIRAVLGKHGAKTISVLDEDKIGKVFTELNNMAQGLAREPGEEG
jgi:hypothetical protein